MTQHWFEDLKQEAMRADPLMSYFAELRTKIEKQASTPTSGSSAQIKIIFIGRYTEVLPATPGRNSFFHWRQRRRSGMGDSQAGRSYRKVLRRPTTGNWTY